MNKLVSKLELHWKIFIGLFLGVIIGYIFYEFGDKTLANDPMILGGIHLSHITWIGQFFLKLLKMIVVPLVVCSISLGISHLPVNNLGKVGLSTILLFKGQMLFAAFFGLLFVNLIKPGEKLANPELLMGSNTPEAHGLDAVVGHKINISEILLSFIPSNIFDALDRGALLEIIIFTILVTIALMQIDGSNAIFRGIKTVLDAILKLTHWIMELAPIGVFALITNTVANGGLQAITDYKDFFLTCILAFATMLFIVGSLMLVVLAKKNPLEFFSNMKQVLLTAFSTASSAATMPTNLKTMKEKFNVPENVSNFVIPLGCTMNMNGVAIYESIVTLFVAQAVLPEPLSLSQQILVVAMIILSTFGTPAIPHASLLTIAIVFQSVGLPLEAIGVILSIDRILDMCRTMLNVTFDSISCLVINRFYGEKPQE